MRYFSLLDVNNAWLGELWKVDLEVVPWQEFYWHSGSWESSSELVPMWLRGESAVQEISQVTAKNLVPEAFEEVK